jgi:hypothetical protein
VLIYASSWLAVGIIYICFVYFFIHQSDAGIFSKIKDVFGGRAPVDIIRDVYLTTKVSPFFNISFLVVLYIAVTANAERDLLKDAFTHLKISGLIKALKIGAFDESSLLKEQSEKELKIARGNILEILSSPTVELVTIVTASGYDFFGEGEALNTPADAKDEKKKQVPLKNGYLLDLLQKREKNFQILLMHPSSEDFCERGQGYFVDHGHKVLQRPEDYKRSIETSVCNIKEAFKKNKNIEVRYTKKNPQWKMIFSEREVWVQPILHGFRSDHTPMYGFRKSENSMYHAFWNLSEEMWHTAEKVDLSSSGSSLST